MRIAFLGDMALFGCFDVRLNSNIKANLQEIASYLDSFDLVIGNLESPFSIKKKTWGAKSAYLCSDIANVKILKWLHVDAVNLANNHMFDYGKEGYETTKSQLDEYGIGYFGSEGKSWKYECDDNKILFSGFCCYSTNPLKLSDNQGGYGINKFNIKDISNLMRKAHENGYFNVIAAHVGLEHVNTPSVDHVRASRKLADICPYFYYGHHPHVIQGVEQYKGALIAHSLGNFCFDDTYTDTSGDKPLITLTEQNRTGIIMEVEIDKNEIVDWKEQMIYIEKSGKIVLKNDDGRLQTYNYELQHCEDNVDQYIHSRNQVLAARVADRKAMRNFSWFIKRMRPRFVKLMFDMKRNAKLYKANVKQYL